MPFSEFKPREMKENPLSLIGDKWMLITAGDETKHNTMTASWGGIGVVWGKDAATVLVRPQRYTREFIEAQERLSLCFFLNGYREQLNLCGTKSGRDLDKANACGFTPVYADQTVYYEQADLVFICRKLYAQDMEPECFLDRAQDEKWYPEHDYHRVYVCEIMKALRKN